MQYYYPFVIPHLPSLCASTVPTLGWSPRATCYPSFAKGGLPSPCSLCALQRILATADLRHMGWPRQPPAAHFQPYSPALPTPCSINICHSTSSSNSQKAAGDNMSTVSLVQPDYPARFAPSPPPTDSQDPPACPLVVASHRSLDLQTLLRVLVTNSHPPPQVVPYIRLHRVPIPHAMPIQLPTTVKKGPLQYYHNLFLSFTLIRYWYCWTFFLRRLTHTNLTPSPLLNFQPPAPYFTHDHRTRWSRLFKNLASSFPHTPASDLSPSSKKTCFIGCPPPLCVTPHLHFHGDYICHVLTMSASQLNVDTSSSPRQPLDSQKNAGADMSMMAFVQPGCPARFAYQNEHRVKGLNAETLARVFLPTPSWLSTPEYAAIRSDTGNPSTCIFFSLNISIYNQQIISSEWTEQWFFMVGRVHPFALTWEIERRDGLESDDDNITEYTVPALIVRDHSYQPSVDTFPTIQPIVSFTGPVIGSGRDLLHGNSAAALDDTQLSCCGFVQLSTFIWLSPFQVFKMTERRDSQFQSNALFTCTGKIAGLLDHQIMKHAPAFDQDYIFIVVPDTWTFHDKAMSDQASATQLLPTTPKSAVGNPSDYSVALARFTSTKKPKAAQSPASPTPHASGPVDPLMLASSRSMPDPYQTPTKRPRLSPETSTIITDCDGQDSPKSDTSSFLSPEDPQSQSPRHIRLWLYQTSRVDIFPTTARPTSAQEYSLNFKASNETIQHDNMSHHPQNQLPKARIAHSLLFLHALPTHISLQPCRLSTPFEFAPFKQIFLQRPSLPPRRSVSVSLTIMLYVSRRVSYLDLTLLPVSYLLSPTLSCGQLFSGSLASLREPRLASLPLVLSQKARHKTSSDWLIGLARAQLVRGLEGPQKLPLSEFSVLPFFHAVNLLPPVPHTPYTKLHGGCSPFLSNLSNHINSLATLSPEAIYHGITRRTEIEQSRCLWCGYIYSQMEDDIPQAVRNCHTCKQYLPEVEFRSVKDPTKFTRDCASCKARRKERVTESRAAVAAMRNIALRLSPRRTRKRTDSLANLTPPKRTAPTPASVNGPQPHVMPALFRGQAPALGLPIPPLGPSTLSAVGGPSPIPPTHVLPTVVLGTPIQDTASTAPVVQGTLYHRNRFLPLLHYCHSVIAAAVILVKAHSLKRDSLVRVLIRLLQEFYTALNDDKMHSCIRCQERWFDMKRNSLKICSRCIVPGNLPDLTMVEEMLIARVHVHVKVLQVRGAQYKYRGHVVHFLRNVGRLFEELPVLPEELDIVLLRPTNMEGDPRFRQQFARDFRVRRPCLLAWLHYLQRHHPGYRDIAVSQDRLHRLPLDGNIVASIASQVADMPDGEVPQGPVEEAVEEDPSDADASAIPNLQRMTDLEYMPRSAQTLHRMPLPSIRRTPIDEFNRSQPLLTLAFPTLYPDGKADFVEPRLRNITYQDYLGHAMRWHDGRFARHKTWPFVALNTLLRAQVRKRSDYFVKQRDSRRQPLTRADLEEAMAEPDEPEAQDLIQSITRQAAVIRGTRPYWYKQRKELEAYAYNLGRPGLFVTASAADYHWESLYQWKAAPEAARMVLSRQLLRDNAHIAAYHFHKRYTLFRTTVLKQKFNLTDFWGRYEWQGRGSSHHHGLYWLSGHPDLDPDNDQSREQFARIWGYHVSAVNPEPQRIQAPGKGILIGNLLEQPLTVQFLSMVVNRVQRHRCNNYCMQLNKHTKQVDLLDKGERNDGQINHYNRLLTVAWLANTDVSPCTSLQQVIDYAAKYCSKLGGFDVPGQGPQPLISFTSKLLNQLVAERDYSKQEVSHLLLGLPLQEGSRTCLYAFPLLRIDGDEVDEAPTFSKTLADLNYVSFLKDPSKWKQWQPGNVNGRPRVLVYFPRYQAAPEGQQWLDYCRAKLTLNHPHRRLLVLTLRPSPIVGSTTVMVMTITVGQKRLDYSLKMINTRLCLLDSPRRPLPDNPLPRRILTYLAAAISTSITTGHGIHPMANDVEVLGPHWRNTLNPQQRLVYDTFMGHFQAQNPTQILLHVDGGGGTGKSFLIKVLSSHLQAAALPNSSPICRVAPTGVASNQIQGSTIHSLLRLPVGADAAALQSRLRHVKYLVIDEKSMLGLEQLARIDSRLRQAFPQRSLEFFGGVSVLLVGDFFQLPPVRQKPLYSTSTSLSSLERRGQVAYRLFDRTVFLTTVQRQVGDDQAQFRQALQELREVKLSIPSWNLLSNRVQARLTQSEVDGFRTALRVYSTKARVNQYNHEHMVHLNAPAIQVEAKNQGNGAGQASSDSAGNLSNKFPVAKGTRVMLTTNLWQPAGLVNGAQGTVYDIAWNAGADPLEDPPAVIMVDFDSYDGPPYLTTNEGRKISPILPVRRDFLVGNETCARTQFPLMVAFAITVHKCQSLTKDQIVTDLATRDFQAGISYVAVSRVTSLQGLLLEVPFDRQSLYNHTPTEGLHACGQQLTDPPYPPRYLD
ncbi:PIF1-like helicase [Hirsutella rhossiliensis]